MLAPCPHDEHAAVAEDKEIEDLAPIEGAEVTSDILDDGKHRSEG